MRLRLFAILILAALPARAQSPSRDWRPEDRTVIGDFSRITSVARVAEVAADDIPPTSHSVPLTNVMRDDTVRPGLTQAEALAAAPAAELGRFRVPRILGEEA